MRKLTIVTGVAFVILIQACTFTTTITKQPEFSVSTDSLGTQLNKLVQCENFNLNGAEITTNGKKETVLEIDVINGKNIPNDEDAMIALGEKIALQVKELMRDKNAYSDYKVLFITETVHGITTKRVERGKDFKNTELKLLSQPGRAI